MASKDDFTLSPQGEVLKPSTSMDETTSVLKALLDALEQGQRCALATVVQTTGSIPRAVGAKMLVFPDSRIVGTVGGGKFESLVIADALAVIENGETSSQSYPLHEGDEHSFGAICGGEVQVLIEAQGPREAIVLVGAGHCSRAIASLAMEAGMGVTVIDDRQALLADFPANRMVCDIPSRYIEEHPWREEEALILVSRAYPIDRDALRAAMNHPGAGYVGMIGSRKKVRKVFEQLVSEGVSPDALRAVYAPIGLDIGADSPGEIAISVLAEVLAVLRKRQGNHLSRTE